MTFTRSGLRVASMLPQNESCMPIVGGEVDSSDGCSHQLLRFVLSRRVEKRSSSTIIVLARVYLPLGFDKNNYIFRLAVPATPCADT